MKNAPVAAEVAKKSAQKKTTQSPKDSASSQIAKGD